MEIKIKLPKENGIRIAEPFTTKEDDNLIINFETEYELNAAKIFLQNGDISGVYDFKKVFTVPDKFMFAGRLMGKVEMLVGGKVAKRWEIFPVDITQTPEGLKFVDCLTAFDERLKKVERFTEII